MNKRHAKKNFRKSVFIFPYGKKTKAGIWLKKQTREYEKLLLKNL